MAAEMLIAASERNLPRLDEAFYFELFTPIGSKPQRIKSPRKTLIDRLPLTAFQAGQFQAQNSAEEIENSAIWATYAAKG